MKEFRFNDESMDVPMNIKHLIVDKNVKNIYRGAFGYQYDLEDVTFEGDLNCIEEKAFFECEKLTELNITAERIEESVFEGCYNLSKVHFTKNVKYIGYNAFAHCDLKEVTFEDIDSVETIEQGVFQYTISLDHDTKEILIQKFGYDIFKET